MKISSINNAKVVSWAKLKMKKYRDIENLSIVESENLVEEALKKGVVREIIYTKKNKEYDVPCYEVTLEIMQRLTTMVNAPSIMAVCSYILPDDIRGNVLLLERIQDPGNLGTIIRSAVAFDFKTIIVSPDTVDVYNDKVIRSSEGMIFNINIIKTDLIDMTKTLRKNGYEIIGTDVIRGKDIRNFKSRKYAFIIGNEGKGVSNELKFECDDFVYIKMNSKCESLNAAVSASIIMYEVNHE